MSVMSVGVSSLAHGVHYAVLAVGLVGLLYLLGPRWAGRRQPPAPRTEHEHRIAELNRQIATGSLGTAINPLAPALTLERTPPPGPSRSALLPIAVISSTAAAAVHAAVGPEHVRESVLFGLFFVGAAVAQLVWSLLMAFAVSRRLLLVGVLGNGCVLVLWALTRTVGLPFGLLPTPEAVGAWDLCCGVWEAVVVITGVQLLRRHPANSLDLPSFAAWPRSAHAWLVASSIVVGTLSLSGAGS